MLAPSFEIRRITTAAPGGATDGIFRVLNSRRLWRATTAAFGVARMTAFYERLWLGGELVVMAIRR
jgi:hypothetical protein